MEFKLKYKDALDRDLNLENLRQSSSELQRH